ncbi:MAG: Tad domain-containing protein [Hyphomicrobiaceae bacterium]|nr:Tad domain-containing protein [Hyphomicrobiaceae bacterium]
MFGLIALIVVSIGGLAIDYSRATSLQSRLQAALDAAVIAGAKANPSDRNTIAESVFEENMRAVDMKGLTSKFHSQNATVFLGSAEAYVDAPFLGILGVSKLTVNKTATAVLSTGGKVCILVLDASAAQAFLVNSGANVESPDCEVHVRSTASPAAIFNASSDIETQRLCIAGTSIIDNGGYHPNLALGCTTIGDPYAGQFPEPSTSSCDYSNLNINGGAVNLKPGVYCGWTNFNAAPDVTFDQGVYIIKDGGWNVNGGNWSGSGVTFYYADQSKIQFNSAVAATLTAPTSGSYANVIMFEKAGLARSPFVVDDSRGFNLTGLIYLPSRDTIFNSASNMEVKNFALVVNTLILDDTNWKLDPGDLAMPASSGGKVVRLIQ